jgi:hypothetical protein
MNPEEALQVLDQATAQAPLNRQHHQQVISALEAIKKVLDEQVAKQDSAKKS